MLRQLEIEIFFNAIFAMFSSKYCVYFSFAKAFYSANELYICYSYLYDKIMLKKTLQFPSSGGVAKIRMNF